MTKERVIWFNFTVEPIMFMHTMILVSNYQVIPQLFLHKFCLRKHDGNSSICSIVQESSANNSIQKVCIFLISVMDKVIEEYS